MHTINLLTKEQIEFFVKANVLHAIDKELIHFKWDEIDIYVEESDAFFYCIVSDKREDKDDGRVAAQHAYEKMPANAASIEDHMRMMMGLTMMVLSDLKEAHPADRPVLSVIKGGLDV